MCKIILASGSPRRRELLKSLGVNFEVKPSEIDESINNITDKPFNEAKILAYKKAKDIAKDLELGLVIGADTIVYYDGKIYGKPKDDNDAFEILSLLSGNVHQVITAISIIDCQTKKEHTDFEISNVKFSTLSKDRINSYIKTGEHTDKAGAYGIQGKGALFVENISGCYFNIVGLPLNKLDKMMNKFSVNFL
jgi:septum formation protein